MAAIMTRRKNDTKEITKLMEECRSLKIPTLGPDVNESWENFGVNKHGEIRFGLAAIKGMGEGPARAIINEREKNGPYKDIYDFVERVDLTNVNRKAFESLAYSGGFDSFGLQREQYFEEVSKGGTFLETLMRYGQKFQFEQQEQQNSLFGGVDAIEIAHPVAPKALPWPTIERLNRERDLVGIYLSAHPLDEYEVVLKYMCNTHCSEIERNGNMQELSKREHVTFGGLVTNVSERISQKTGKPFGIVTIEDFESSGELALFGDDWLRWGNQLKKDYTIYVTAQVKERYRPGSNIFGMTIENVQQLYDVKRNQIEKLTIKVREDALDELLAMDLATLINGTKGNTELYIQVELKDRNEKLMLKSQQAKVNVDHKILTFIENHDGLEYQIN